MPSTAWLLVIAAGVLEAFWAQGLKYSDGFTRLWPSVFTIAGAALSFVLLGQAMKTLPVGTAYAVWVGIGATGAAVLAVVLFGEAVNAMRLGGIALILAGIVVLKLS